MYSLSNKTTFMNHHELYCFKTCGVSQIVFEYSVGTKLAVADADPAAVVVVVVDDNTTGIDPPSILLRPFSTVIVVAWDGFRKINSDVSFVLALHSTLFKIPKYRMFGAKICWLENLPRIVDVHWLRVCIGLKRYFSTLKFWNFSWILEWRHRSLFQKVQ